MTPCKRTLRGQAGLMAAVVAILSVAAGCSGPEADQELPPVAKRSLAYSRLRITNVGSTPIRQFAVGFCGGAEVRFGDIGPGETSGYRDVPHGVFSSAAFRYEWEGQPVTQPDIDCVGVSPLPGGDYTYRIWFEPFRKRGLIRVDDVFEGTPENR